MRVSTCVFGCVGGMCGRVGRGFGVNLQCVCVCAALKVIITPFPLAGSVCLSMRLVVVLSLEVCFVGFGGACLSPFPFRSSSPADA